MEFVAFLSLSVVIKKNFKQFSYKKSHTILSRGRKGELGKYQKQVTGVLVSYVSA